MLKFVSLEQSHQLMAALATNARWCNVDPGKAQEMIRDPRRAGVLFGEFLNRGSAQPAASETIRRWSEEDGVIRFTVKTDGATGEEWSKRLRNTDGGIGECACALLDSEEFQPTNGTEVEVTVFKGAMFNDEERTNQKARVEAAKRGLAAPNMEIACLIREKFSDEETMAMGLRWIQVMHDPKPIPRVSRVATFLLGVGLIRGCCGIEALDEIQLPQSVGTGFAFVAPPTVP